MGFGHLPLLALALRLLTKPALVVHPAKIEGVRGGFSSAEKGAASPKLLAYYFQFEQEEPDPLLSWLRQRRLVCHFPDFRMR